VKNLSDNTGIRVLERAISVLNYIAREDKNTGVTDISLATGLSKTTVHRILSTLLKNNLVIKQTSGTYTIGPSVLIWADSYRLRSGLIEISRSHIEELCESSGETVHLFSFENGRACYIDKREGRHPVGMISRIGAPIEMYCTSAGRAILANLPQGELIPYIASLKLEKRTPFTVTSREMLLSILDEIRKKGYAEENQENEEGIRCVGSAIRDHRGYPVGAISISAPAYRFTSSEVDLFGPKVFEKTEIISGNLGFRK
jgi:IclR family acetate operon transcriptional repressor